MQKEVMLGVTMVLAVVFFPSWQSVNVQTVGNETTAELPKVFLLGAHEGAYEQLVVDYETSLLSVCDQDMDQAFQKWFSMLQEMEAYADQISFDIKGVKLWLNVFWEPDGQIKHIAYYLRPNSRNINTDEMTAFFSSFMNHYRFPLISKAPFAHYSSAFFPTRPQTIKRN